MKAFITGGAKNGKSTLAQELAVHLSAGGVRYYIATMIPADAEDCERIRRHVADRAGLGFETIECPRRILSCLDAADRHGAFLLDSVTALVQNELFPPEEGYALDESAAERCVSELLTFADSVENAVFVSDFIYADAETYDPVTESYRRALAAADRMLAQKCDVVAELAAGRRIVHKGGLPI